MFEVKNKGKSKTFLLQTAKSGEFAGKYILTLGKGRYTVTIFGSNNFAGNFAGLAQFQFKNSELLPKDSPKLFINDKIMAYVKTTIGKKVGRGECWDVAQMALDLTGADWQRTKGYGTQYNWKKQRQCPVTSFNSPGFPYEKSLKMATQLKAMAPLTTLPLSGKF